MKTIQLSDDWRNLISEIERTGEPVALEFDGHISGLLLQRDTAQRVVARYTDVAPNHAQAMATSDRTVTYFDLLRADPTLVPRVDGRPLRFVSVMNSGFVDPQQFYQFQDSATSQVHLFRADELKQAIGCSFAPVEFVTEAMREFAKERQNG